MDSRPRGDTINLYNSSSKLQSFFGVDDPQELQIAKSQIQTHKNKKRHTATRNSTSHKRSSSSRKSRKQSTSKRRSSSKKSSKRSSLFRAFRISMNSSDTAPQKLRWRPSLRIIYDDTAILDALTTFMRRSFNAENILFLRAARALLDVDEELIDEAIASIYTDFIGLSATSPINLSYECLMQILWQRDQLDSYDLATKRVLFDTCVGEIESLVLSSVLPAFYESDCFEEAARKSEHYASYRVHAKNRRNKSKYAKLESPPIKLEISHSAESYFAFDVESP